MKNILLFGAGGFLANHIIKKIDVATSLTLDDVDITNKEGVSSIIRIKKPDIIINCAALTDITFCERNPEKAWKVNVDGVKNIADSASDVGAYLVHFSSDYAINPINEYGKTKAASEKISNGLVLRTNFYDESHWLFRKLEKGVKVELMNNMSFNPISVYGLIDYMKKLIALRYKGVVNIGVEDKLSYYDFGMNLCKFFGFNEELLYPVKSIDTRYKYPMDTYLDLSVLKNLGLKTLDIKTDMEIIKNETEK